MVHKVVDPVTPEGLDLSIRGQHAAEGDQDADEEWIGEGCKDGVGHVRGDELTGPGVDKLVREHDEERDAGFAGVGEGSQSCNTDTRSRRRHRCKGRGSLRR